MTNSKSEKLIFEKLVKLGAQDSFGKVISSYRTIIEDDQIFGLDLIGLGLSYLPNSVFSDIPDLTHLYLSWNNINGLEVDVFDKLVNLVHLDLRGSGLISIRQGIFDKLIYLERIELNDNKLEAIPDDLFRYNRNLREINLSNNKINVIPGVIFKHLRNLERLYLYFNPISEDIAMGDYYDRDTVVEAIQKLINLFGK